jgi:hypothetical protein
MDSLGNKLNECLISLKKINDRTVDPLGFLAAENDVIKRGNNYIFQ